MPTAVARPWPSGPVVVSIAGCSPYSGWPAAGECSWRKRDVVDRHAVHGRSGAAAHTAASSHGRPTARSGRGPASADRRHRICGSGSRARSRHRPCPSAGRDGRIGALRRVDRQRADGVGHAAGRRDGRARICAWRARAGWTDDMPSTSAMAPLYGAAPANGRGNRRRGRRGWRGALPDRLCPHRHGRACPGHRRTGRRSVRGHRVSPSILPPGKGTWQPPGVVLAAH